MDAQRGIKASCSKCGSPLSAARGACKRCGAIASDGADPQYGLLDLGGTAESSDAIALDTSVERVAPRRAKRSGTTPVQQGAAAASPGRAAARTVSDTGGRTGASSARNPAVAAAPARTGASSTRNPAVNAGGATAASAGGAPAKRGQAAAALPDLPDLDDPAAMPYGRGMMLGEDPFNAAFNGTNDQKIELEESEPEEEAV